MTIKLFWARGLAAFFLTFAATPAFTDDHGVNFQPSEYAVASDMAAEALLLDVARAGSRMIAVGEFGHVLLSDDNGDSWRQATSVPTRNTLVSVTFIDNQTGYAVGHAATILKTTDGGENWQLQYIERGGETPLFAVYFDDAQKGIAVGGFSYTFETTNGGKSWTQRALVEDSYDDFHLNDLFTDKKGNLFIPAEFGMFINRVTADKTGRLLKLDMTDLSGVVLGLIMEIFWFSACAAMCGALPMAVRTGSASKPAPINRCPAGYN